MLETMKEFFENRIDHYDEHMLTAIEGAQEFYPYTSHRLPRIKEAKILDLGCGTGLELKEYLTMFPDAKITGIDLSQDMLNVLKSKFPKANLNLICDSYFDVQFGENIFDAAVSVESLHHFTQKEKIPLYQKIFTALKEDGYFVLTDYFSLSDEEESKYFEEFRKLKASEKTNDNEIYHYDTPLTLEHEIEALQKAGFLSISVLEQWGSTYTIKATKKETEPMVYNGPELSRRLEKLSYDTMLLVSQNFETDKINEVTKIVLETDDPTEADCKIQELLNE